MDEIERRARSLYAAAREAASVRAVLPVRYFEDWEQLTDAQRDAYRQQAQSEKGTNLNG